MRAPALSAAKSPRLPARTETRDIIDFVLGKNDLKTWFRFCGTMFSLVVSKSPHRVCRLQAAKPTGCFYMPYAHDMREKTCQTRNRGIYTPGRQPPFVEKTMAFSAHCPAAARADAAFCM
jgi:hypothetical protein